MPELRSAFYRGRISHARVLPRPHRFGYRTSFLYLDLDELPQLFDGFRLWSHERANLASFRRADYLGPTELPLREAVLRRVEMATGHRPAGPIRLLTRIRRFGWVFNPVSFYFCFDEGGEELDAVVAEITNTPWNERHAYVLDTRCPEGEASALEERSFEFDKEFHVSPFFDMSQRYRWKVSTPGEKLDIRMANLEGDSCVFSASLELERHPLDGRALRSALVRHPLASFGVWLAIHWQALRLWSKRVPFFTHPAKRSPSMPLAGMAKSDS